MPFGKKAQATALGPTARGSDLEYLPPRAASGPARVGLDIRLRPSELCNRTLLALKCSATSTAPPIMCGPKLTELGQEPIETATSSSIPGGSLAKQCRVRASFGRSWPRLVEVGPVWVHSGPSSAPMCRLRAQSGFQVKPRLVEFGPRFFDSGRHQLRLCPSGPKCRSKSSLAAGRHLGKK